MDIILLKVVVTVVMVTGLSVVAERVGPRAAGILAGYPAGSAIALFFIGLELSADFAGASALYNVFGLTALLCFLWIYYQVSRRAGQVPARKWISVLTASMVAVASFLLIVSGLNALHVSPAVGLLVTAAALFFFQRIFRTIDNAHIHARVRLGPRVLMFRAGLSAGIILVVTAAAHLVGPDLAGLFTAFPATTLPLILIVHLTYGGQQAHTVIKNVPTGLWALVFYSLTVSFAYPRLGIYYGTLASFGVATVYLLALAGVQKAQSAQLAEGERAAKSRI